MLSFLMQRLFLPARGVIELSTSGEACWNGMVKIGQRTDAIGLRE